MKKPATPTLRFGLLGALAVIGAGLACAPSPDTSARVALVAPDLPGFAPVSDLLDHRCGSLDCHGSVGRNLRLVGHEGLRLDPADVPGGSDTTAAELAANFASVVGLEPELMAAVFADGGARPERLTLVRKARGTENHKGGALIVVGDDQDLCLTSWLAGAVLQGACVRAVTSTP
jgi:hypothetical protein